MTMKKSAVAIATAAAVLISPAQPVFAQSFSTSTTTDPNPGRQDVVTQDGDRSSLCEAEWFASSVYDPHLDDAPNSGYYYKVKGPHTAGGPSGAINPDSHGTLVIQHYPTRHYDYVYFRTVVGADVDVNNAQVVFDLPPLPEGINWEVEENKPLANDQRWSYLSGTDFSPLDKEPEGFLETNADGSGTLTYNFDTLKAKTGTALMVKAGPFASGELSNFTEKMPDMLKVDATLTGSFNIGDVPECDPRGAYDDSFTTPGQNVIVNLNDEATFPDYTQFITDPNTDPDELVTDSNGNPVPGWGIEVDEATGQVIATPPAGTKPGVYTVVVTAKIDGSGEIQIPARIHVQSGEPAYDDSSTTADEYVIVNLNGEEGIPSHYTYEVSSAPEGWTVTVNENGQVTAEPAETAKPGVYNVTIIASGGEGEPKIEIPARIHIIGEPDITMEIGYQIDGKFYPGVSTDTKAVAGHIVTIINADGTREQYFIPNGIDGEDGQKGEKGDQGEKGKDGIDGKSALVEITPGEKDGVTGHIVITYLDIDGDGSYTEGKDEKISESFIADGKDGRDGKDGKDGETSSVVVVEAEGGFKVITYLGQTQISETFIADGKDGKDGANADVRTEKGTDEAGNTGTWIYTYIDGELTSEAFIADGKNGVDGKDGADGKDGRDGVDGKNGTVEVVAGEKDGVTGVWVISYFDGKVVSREFVANGTDGADGTDGKDGKDGINADIRVEVGVDANGNTGTWIYTYIDGEQTSSVFVKDGKDGRDGVDGKSSKVETEAGVLNGKTGVWIFTYFDANGDGQFTEGEVISREFVANGIDGRTTAVSTTKTIRDGVAGTIIVTYYDTDGDGAYTPGVDIQISEVFVPNPRDSKVVVEPGVKDGKDGQWVITFFDDNGDGIFAADEEVSREFVANGENGRDGLSTDVRVVRGQDDLGNTGSWIYTYVDANGDGEFTEAERTGASFVADGKNAPATTIKLEAGEKDGRTGTWVITYVDTNGDGEFTADEEVSREFVTNGIDGKDGKDGADGETPVIGENGNWYIGGKDTGVPARGQDGRDGQTPVIGENGNWYIDGRDTGVKATCDCAPGQDGKSITIVDQGRTDTGDVWVEFSDGTRVVIPAGPRGGNTEFGVPEAPQNGSADVNPRCLPAALSVSLPVLLLLPFGLATQVEIPGLSGIMADINARMARVNDDVQRQLGIRNDSQAGTASEASAALAQFGKIGGPVGGALVALAFAGLITKYLVDNCSPVAEGEQPGAFALPEDWTNSSN